MLIYGYGNPGRQDDGLGNAFAEAMEAWAMDQKFNHIAFDSNYQLNIEDAAGIADKDLVIFADASAEEIEDFILTPVDETSTVAFTTHAASPGYVVRLCKELYQKVPAVFLLHIKGYEWSFREGLTARAQHNLDAAVEALKTKLGFPQSLIESFNIKYHFDRN